MYSSSLLEADPSIMESNLRFIKNDPEESLLSELIKDDKVRRDNIPYRIVQPEPGICVKILTRIDLEKVFINICQSDGIPEPPPITSSELIEMLQSETESQFRVPMSISELRKMPNTKGVEVTVCDVAIHPNFFAKAKKEDLFMDYLIQIIIEAFDVKYNVALDGGQCTFLKNKKQMGQLIKHRIQNRDRKMVSDSYGDNDTLLALRNGDGSTGKKLIEEVRNIGVHSKNNIQGRLIIDTDDHIQIIAEFHLPQVQHVDDILLDINDDHLLLMVPKYNYCFEGDLGQFIDENKTTAYFDNQTKNLCVTMPIVRN